MFSGLLINYEYPGTTSPTLDFDSHHDYRGHVIRTTFGRLSNVGLPGCRFVEPTSRHGFGKVNIKSRKQQER